MKNKIILKVFVLGFLSLLVASCATPMSAENKQLVHKISIQEDIKTPEELSFTSNASSAGYLMGGIVGAVVVGETIEKTHGNALQKRMFDNKIFINKIVKEQFISQIDRKKNLEITNEKIADAKMEVNIQSYGLVTLPWSSGDVFTPLIDIHAVLIRNNKVIWSARGYTTNFTKGLPQYTLEQLHKNPNFLYGMWNAAAEKVVKEILDTLQ